MDGSVQQRMHKVNVVTDESRLLTAERAIQNKNSKPSSISFLIVFLVLLFGSFGFLALH